MSIKTKVPKINKEQKCNQPVTMKYTISMKWLVLWSLWLARLVRQPTLELRVSSGLLRGSVDPDGSHISYLGIPYASVGAEHRFKAPGPEPIWDSVFEAVNEHIRCTQRISDRTVVGIENCLALNIHTPINIDADSRVPVMVFIHGGAYFQGSGSKMLYGPEYLVPKGVILVTINYRLNIQGFLCLRTKDAPGNAGMKDQVAALRWIRKNIKAFGGDPDNVTIFGESAGGSAVSYHVLSPMSKGLFHRAITQSGSSLAPWGYQLRPVYMASLLAKTMGYHTEDPKELYDFFMNKSDDELIVTRVPRKEGNTIISEVLYAPCTEVALDGEEPFLTGIPYELLSRGEYNKVPIIIGTNSAEGLLFAALENETTISKLSFEKSLPKDLVIPEHKRAEIADRLKKLYMDDDEITKDTLLKFARFPGELYFNLPCFMETEFILNTTDKPVYNYLFDYNGWRNVPKLTLPRAFSRSSGATHADELFYLFKSFRVSWTLFEHKMIDTMTTLWTNFAKFGDPTPPGSPPALKWPPSARGSPTALVLTSLQTQPLCDSPTLLYWRELYQKYRRKHY